MKNKLNRIISSLLILAFLISTLTVFAFASEGGTAGEGENELTKSLILRRTFDEGWDYNIGFASDAEKGNNFYIDYEEDSEYNYNYFFRLEVANGDNSFVQYAPIGADMVNTGSTVIEVSYKVDDYASLGSIIQLQTGKSKKALTLLSLTNNELISFDKSSLGLLGNEWVDIVFVFDWDNGKITVGSSAPELAGKGKVEDGAATLNEKYTYQKTVALDSFYSAGDISISYLRFNIPATSGRGVTLDESIGMSYCLDNLAIYNCDKASTAEFESYEFGRNVDTSADKNIPIQSGSGSKTAAQLLEEALCMKVGVDFALVRNKKATIFKNSETGNIYGAPANVNGEVMIPLQLLLDYIEFPYYLHPDNLSFDITTGTSVTYITVGRDSAKVDTTRVELAAAPDYVVNKNGDSYLAIALADVETLFPGWLVTYDDMGLIIVYEDTTPDDKEDNEEIVNRDDNLDTMLDIMKKFIFDTEEADKQADAFNAMGTKIFNDAKNNTNNFTHPYIYTNQSTFDRLKAVYIAEEGAENYNESLYDYIQSRILSANSYLDTYADMNGENFVKLKFKPVNPYLEKSDDPQYANEPITQDGYDPEGGRLNVTGTYTSFLPTVAFAYQMTGEKKYVDFAYAWMSALVTWEHWGPGHFLNAAEAASSFSVAYDWFYNGFKANGYDTDVLAEGLYNLTIHDGYISSMSLPCEHPRIAKWGNGSFYATAESNWNAVCTAGMVTASLAIFDYLSADAGRVTKFNEAIYLTGNNMSNLPEYGLDEYAPDGSYIESASYWAYGTNAFFHLVMALDSATGKDYGLMDTWGIDKTCYYACQIASSDGFIWNYHDGGGDGVTSSNVLGRVDSSTFNFVGKYLNDPGLIALRQQHLERGYNSITLYDLIYYPFDIEADSSVSLPLDYEMQGIQGFVSRDSWDAGAMYTGIMGGANNCNHGQIDSGNFIYHNKGVVWFMDLGSEDYNVPGYFASERYKYYRANGEGQNIVIISDNSDLMYGQHSTGEGKITSTYSNEYGAYAILDNKSAYTSKVPEANRGIFITNDRSTVVIQDEIKVTGESMDFNWIAHTAVDDIEISSDGLTAYLIQTVKSDDGKVNEYVLRASIVSPRNDLKFDYYDRIDDYHILNSTYASTPSGGVSEYSRDGLKRLVISCENTSNFMLAVVIELVDSVDSTQPVGYSFKNMVNWSWDKNLPSAAPEVGEVGEVRSEPMPDQIDVYNSDVRSVIRTEEELFVKYLDNFYKGVTNVAYILKDPSITIDKHPEIKESVATHNDHKTVYANYKAFMDEVIANTNSLALGLSGIPAAEADEAPAE